MTLRRKIVALTLCLLLLFAMTAAASVLLQSKISEQFSGVVDDYLPLNAAVATIDVFTDRYELDLRRLAADLRDAGAGAAAITQQGEVERLTEARGLTATFQKAEAQLDPVDMTIMGQLPPRADGAARPRFTLSLVLKRILLPYQRGEHVSLTFADSSAFGRLSI